LAIVERGKTPHLYDHKNKILPPGAGLVVRKTAWLDRVPRRLVLNHQGKEAGMASEDLEALLHIQKAGWEIWYNPDMVVYHKIPNARLKIDYLRLLTRCVGLSRHRLRMMTLKSWQRPLAFPAYLANDMRRLVLHLIKHGLDVKQDPVAACQRELLSSSLVSPLFLLKKQYSDVQETIKTKKYLRNSSMILEVIAEGFEEHRFQLVSQEIKPIAQEKLSPNYSEILLRLQNQQGQILHPREFMPIAQHYKLMKTIDRWVIRTLFSQIAEHPPNSQVPECYEINLSIDSVYDDRFLEFLKQEFAHWQIYPELIRFSLPEHQAIAHLDQLIKFISGIKNIGSHFVLDHVGVQNPVPDYLKKTAA
jgi:EAL domain-containing protein (putative c-di-GMP-specific phosphodiesterase class I)